MDLDLTVLRLDVSLPPPVADALPIERADERDAADPHGDRGGADDDRRVGGRDTTDPGTDDDTGGSLRRRVAPAALALTGIGLFVALAVVFYRRRRAGDDDTEPEDVDREGVEGPENANTGEDDADGRDGEYVPRAEVPDVDVAPVVGMAFLAVLGAVVRALERRRREESEPAADVDRDATAVAEPVTERQG